ncbi:hypothetical protein ES703_93253 [subsurface metagenome]
MPDNCPKAICQSCGRRYSGWSLAQRETCDCGGKLIIDFPYSAIIAYVKAGDNKRGYLGG